MVARSLQLVYLVLGQTAVQQRQGLVGGAQGMQQCLLVEKNAVAGSTKAQGAIEQPPVFVSVLWLGVGKLDFLQRRQASAGQPAAEPQHRGDTGILERPGLGPILRISDAP
ncbi:hypothetical protein D3C78_1093090 [compost metagenome]